MFVKKDGFPGKYGKYFLSKEVLTEYIVFNIPILNSVGLEVSELTENKIKISAPLFDNRNHYGLAFGGSIATPGIVAEDGQFLSITHLSKIILWRKEKQNELKNKNK